MQEATSVAWLAELATNLLVSLIVFPVGYLIGKRHWRDFFVRPPVP